MEILKLLLNNSDAIIISIIGAFIYDKLKICFEKFKVNINETLSDGQVLPYCGGITVIHTPGHTPGHISLYVNKFKLLIAGDILVVNEDTLCPCDKSLNYDDALNYQSIKN